MVDPAVEIFLAVLAILIVVAFVYILLRGVVTIPPHSQGVLLLLGGFRRVLNPGFHLVSPLAHVIRVDLRTTVLSIPSQSLLTADGRALDVDAVVSYRIVDPARATFQVRDLPAAMIAFAQTGVRAVIGGARFEEIPSARARLNGELKALLEEKSETWGIRVEAAEIKDALPPGTIPSGSRAPVTIRTSDPVPGSSWGAPLP